MGLIFSAAFSFLLRTVVLKFGVFTVLFLVVSSFVSYLASKVNIISPDMINTQLSNWTPHMWFFADLFAIPFGFPLVITACIIRFSIRRLPVIG